MPTMSDVHVRPVDGRWAVQLEGELEPLATFDDRQAALEQGRGAARERDCELFVHDEDDVVERVLAREGVAEGRPLVEGAPGPALDADHHDGALDPLPVSNALLRGTLHWQHLPRDGERDREPAIARVEALPGWWGGPVHVHPATAEHLTVVTGRLGVHVEGERRFLAAGDTITFEPGELHTIWNAGSSPLELLARFDRAGRMPEFLTTMFGLGHDGVGVVPRQLRQLATGYPDDIRWQPRWRYPAVAAALLAGVLARRGSRR